MYNLLQLTHYLDCMKSCVRGKLLTLSCPLPSSIQTCCLLCFSKVRHTQIPKPKLMDEHEEGKKAMERSKNERNHVLLVTLLWPCSPVSARLACFSGSAWCTKVFPHLSERIRRHFGRIRCSQVLPPNLIRNKSCIFEKQFQIWQQTFVFSQSYNIKRSQSGLLRLDFWNILFWFRMQTSGLLEC